MRIKRLWLAGPDLWFPAARELHARKVALCEAAGFEASGPLDVELVETEVSEAMAREIYAARLGRLRASDAVIANVSPWRGPGCDPGTAFEIGAAAALGKPVFAYLNVEDEGDADHRDRVDAIYGANLSDDGRWIDDLGCEIEDFGLPENLMLWAEARRLTVVVTPDPMGDLTGFELSLDTLGLYAD